MTDAQKQQFKQEIKDEVKQEILDDIVNHITNKLKIRVESREPREVYVSIYWEIESPRPYNPYNRMSIDDDYCKIED